MYLTDARLPEVDFKSKDIYQYKFGVPVEVRRSKTLLRKLSIA